MERNSDVAPTAHFPKGERQHASHFLILRKGNIRRCGCFDEMFGRGGNEREKSSQSIDNCFEALMRMDFVILFDVYA